VAQAPGGLGPPPVACGNTAHAYRIRYVCRARRVPLLILLLLAPVPATATAATHSKAPSILYSLDAKGARIAKSGGTLWLSLPANAPVTWFTDRPYRNAGSVRLVDLYGIWDASGFSDDPPNAALLTTHKGVEHTHVVELTTPRSAKGRVSFAIRAVPNAVEAGHVHAHDLAAGRFGRARLFIDDAALAPCGSTLRYVKPEPSATTTAVPPFVVQCLLGPGASVAGYPSAGYMASLFACRAAGGGTRNAPLQTNGTTLSIYGCGTQTNPELDMDVWLRTTWNDGPCTTTTASQVTVRNADATATLRISLLIDYPIFF